MNYLQALEYLPKSDTEGEVLTTMHILLRNVGIELADRYDKQLTKDIGPDWLEALATLRNSHLTMIDPYFVLSEPLKYPDSPTRACLPHGADFYNKLDAALKVRNCWYHHENSELSLKMLNQSVLTLQVFGKAAQMALASRCKSILHRIEQIQNGSFISEKDDGKQTLIGQLDRLKQELEGARSREKKANDDMLVAQELLDQAAISANPSTISEDEQSQTKLEVALAMALEEKERLEYLVESLAIAADAQAPVEEEKQIGIGHKWQGPIPDRKVKLVALKDDLFDDALKKFVAEEFGPTSTKSISKFRAIVPPNSTIYLSEQGNAVAYLNGDPIFIGSLSETSAKSSEDVIGFFTPNNYVLRINGDIEDVKTGQTLRAAIGPVKGEIGSDLLLLRPSGGLLKITTSGLIACQVRGEWVPLRKVQAQRWFPGHLSKA